MGLYLQFTLENLKGKGEKEGKRGRRGRGWGEGRDGGGGIGSRDDYRSSALNRLAIGTSHGKAGIIGALGTVGMDYAGLGGAVLDGVVNGSIAFGVEGTDKIAAKGSPAKRDTDVEWGGVGIGAKGVDGGRELLWVGGANGTGVTGSQK